MRCFQLPNSGREVTGQNCCSMKAMSEGVEKRDSESFIFFFHCARALKLPSDILLSSEEKDILLYSTHWWNSLLQDVDGSPWLR